MLFDDGCYERRGAQEAYCTKCGWDIREYHRRLDLLRSGELQKDGMGYYRLFLKKKKQPPKGL